MSIVHCDFCNSNIDTDYDVEHFVNEDLDHCIEEEQYDSDMEAKRKLENAAPELLEGAINLLKTIKNVSGLDTDHRDAAHRITEAEKRLQQAIKKATE